MTVTLRHADLLEQPFSRQFVEAVQAVIATSGPGRLRQDVALHIIGVGIWGFGPRSRIKHRGAKKLEALIAQNIKFIEAKTDEVIAVCHALSEAQRN
jgi:hypothetical protein